MANAMATAIATNDPKNRATVTRKHKMKATQQKMAPIYQRVNEAIAAVAKEGNYTFLLDPTMIQTSQATNFYLNPSLSEDVTAKIKTKLGL